MYYVYILQSKKNKKLYVGMTNNIKRRFSEHNFSNRKTNEWTKRNRPFKLIFYEVFINKKDAQKDEMFFKSGYGREVLRDKLENSIES